MESPVVLLALGIVIGVMLTAKPIREVVGLLGHEARVYILFGLLLFGATWALQGWGMAAVLVAYGLYQIIGRRADGIKNLLGWFHWPKRKPKEPSTDGVPAKERPVGEKLTEPPCGQANQAHPDHSSNQTPPSGGDDETFIPPG